MQNLRSPDGLQFNLLFMFRMFYNHLYSGLDGVEVIEIINCPSRMFYWWNDFLLIRLCPLGGGGGGWTTVMIYWQTTKSIPCYCPLINCFCPPCQRWGTNKFLFIERRKMSSLLPPHTHRIQVSRIIPPEWICRCQQQTREGQISDSDTFIRAARRWLLQEEDIKISHCR